MQLTNVRGIEGAASRATLGMRHLIGKQCPRLFFKGVVLVERLCTEGPNLLAWDCLRETFSLAPGVEWEVSDGV